MTKVLSLKNREEVIEAIREREAFNASKMVGIQVTKSFETIKDYKGYFANLTAGALKGPSRVEFEANKGNLVYVVYSYDTPIYWVYSNGDEYLEEEFFSQTTERHQDLVREYWNA